MAITESAKRVYLKNPNKCPYCGAGSIDIDSDIEAHSDDSAHLFMFCPVCRGRWRNIYRISDVEEVREGSVALQITNGLRTQ